MASIITSVKTLVDSSNQSTDYATTSWTPTAIVYFVAVVLTVSSGNPPTPTLSGNGITWSSPITNGTFNGGLHRLTTFSGYNASPSAGALTIGIGGNSCTGCCVQIVSASGLNTTTHFRSSNGASGAASGTLTCGTLSDFSGSVNLGFFACGSGNVTPGTDYTEVNELNMSNPTVSFNTETWTNPTDGVVDASQASATGWRGAAINVNDAIVPTGIPLMFFTRDT